MRYDSVKSVRFQIINLINLKDTKIEISVSQIQNGRPNDILKTMDSGDNFEKMYSSVVALKACTVNSRMVFLYLPIENHLQDVTGRAQLIRTFSLARFSFKVPGIQIYSVF